MAHKWRTPTPAASLLVRGFSFSLAKSRVLLRLSVQCTSEPDLFPSSNGPDPGAPVRGSSSFFQPPQYLRAVVVPSRCQVPASREMAPFTIGRLVNAHANLIAVRVNASVNSLTNVSAADGPLASYGIGRVFAPRS